MSAHESIVHHPEATAELLDAYSPDQFRIVESERVGDVIDFAPRVLDQYHRWLGSGAEQALVGIITSGEESYGIMHAAAIENIKDGYKAGLVLTRFPKSLSERADPIGLVDDTGLRNTDFEVREIQGRVFVANHTGKNMRVISQAAFVAELSADDRFGFETGYTRPKEANPPSGFGLSGAWAAQASDIKKLFS